MTEAQGVVVKERADRADTEAQAVRGFLVADRFELEGAHGCTRPEGSALAGSAFARLWSGSRGPMLTSHSILLSVG
jgi:hypothetical protein